MPFDYLNQGHRKQILDEVINSEENKRRKEQSLMAYEIFKGEQGKFILSKIQQELGVDAAKNSRTITSINLTEKLVKEKSALYRMAPERSFSNLTENQLAHVEKIYDIANADVKFKKANEIYKLLDQAAIQVVLRDGHIKFRPYYQHHYDVVPSSHDPEVADAYIVSSFDKSRLFTSLSSGNSSAFSFLQKGYFTDMQNQRIGDPDDYRQSTKIFLWWTKDFNFFTNGKGEFVDENGLRIVPKDEDLLNPIGALPFIDVASDKDYEFFVRSGHNISQFSLDLGALLSDVAEIARLQGFSQAVISSVEEPKDLRVGPRRVIWLKVSPNDSDATRPTFEFTSPSPDLSASLQLISNYLSLFLTSEGLSPKIVNTAGEKESFSSGIDRFLSMIEKFDSSQDDMETFRFAEMKAYELIKRWNNTFYTATTNGFSDELSGTFLPEDSELSVKYMKPQMLLSDTDKLAVIEKKLDLRLISQAEAIAEDREIPIEEALKVLETIKIDEDELTNGGIEADFEGQKGQA